MPSQLINSKETLRDFLLKTQKRIEKPGLIFLDLEGVNLSRHGVVALMQFLMPPDPIVYLIDVHVLGKEAFTTHLDGPLMPSLQSILESADIAKVFFDVRNDCNALYFHFGINLRCVVDIQLLEFATRTHRSRFVNGLSKCVSHEVTRLPAGMKDWSTHKEIGQNLFVPEKGGKYEILLQRPLPQEIIDYCEQDVLVMPALLMLYAQRLKPHTSAQLQDLVDARIALAKTADFQGKGRHMAVVPMLRASINTDVSDLSFPMRIIDSSQIAELCRLGHEPKDTVSKAEANSRLSSNAEHDLASKVVTSQPGLLRKGSGDLKDESSSFRMDSIANALRSSLRSDTGDEDDDDDHRSSG